MRIDVRRANSFAVRLFKTVIETVGAKGVLFCLLLLFTLTLRAQSFVAVDDYAITGPLQKVRVNVTINDEVPCASPVMRLINPPAAAATVEIKAGGYIEVTPAITIRNQNITIEYGIKCGSTEKTATLTVNVTEFNNPANVVPSNIVCYDDMTQSVNFSPQLKYIAGSGNIKMDGFSMPLVGDINGDGKPEIVALGLGNNDGGSHTDGVTSDGLAARAWYVHVFDGQTGARVWSVNLGEDKSGISLLTSNINHLGHSGITDNTSETNDQFQLRYWPRHNSPGHLAIADLDNNGTAEIVVAETGNKGRIYALTPTLDSITRKIKGFSKLWGSTIPNYKTGVTGNHETYGAGVPYIADLNGDGKPEVIIYNKIYNGQTGALYCTLQTLKTFANPVRDSITTFRNNYAYVGRQPLTREGDQYTPCMNIVDIDGDGILDIVAGSKVYTIKEVNGVPSFNAATDIIHGPSQVTVKRGTNYGTSETVYLADGFTTVADIDMDGKLDVIVINKIERVGLDNNRYILYVWDPLTTPNVVKAAMILYEDGWEGYISYPFVGDINGRLDSKNGQKRMPELCFVTGRLYTKGGESSTPVKPHPQSTGANGFTVTSSSDSTINNARFNTGSGYTTTNGFVLGWTWFDGNAPIEERLRLSWALEIVDHSQMTGITMFDFDNDGVMDVCYKDENSLRVISPSRKNYIPFDDPDGGNNAVRFKQTGIYSYTGYEAPVIADVNMDGSADIITMNHSDATIYKSYSYIYVFEHATNTSKWAPCPPVWNQVIYHPLLINEDLTVPAKPQSMLTAYQHPSGHTIYPYNAQWVQQPVVKAGNDFRPVVRKPDAIIRNMKVNVVSTNETKVTLTIFNKGAASISADAHITFYDGGTDGSGTMTLATKKEAQKVGIDIFPNEHREIVYTLTGFNYNGHLIWARIMDYNYQFVEPGQTDCDETNNHMGATHCPSFIYTTTAERTTFCGANDRIKLTAVPDPGATVNSPTYQWYRNDIQLPSATGSEYFATSVGEYKCYVIDHACRDYSTTVNITLYNPVAQDDYALTLPQTPITVGVLAGDPWAVTCRPTLAIVEQPKHGSAQLNASGDSVIYSPSMGFAGIDSLKWSSSANGMTETGMLYIIVIDGADEYNACNGQNINISFTSIPDVQLYWYDVQTGENPPATGPSFIKTINNVTSAQTLWVEARWKGKKFARRKVELRVFSTPTINTVQNQTVCAGAPLNISFSGTNANIYEYSLSGNNIGLADGSGDISTTAINTGSVALVANVAVTPKNANCTGTPVSFTITVNPLPVINDTTITICSGSSFSISLAHGSHGDVIPSGTKYTWSVADNPFVSGETDNPNTPANDISNGILTNNTSNMQTVTYSVLPQANNCSGAAFMVTVNVLISSLFKYPDIRIYACSVADNINLSKFLDTLNVTAINWTGKAVAPPISANGIIDGSLLHDKATYTYEYEITNTCISNIRSKVYLHAINKNKDFNLRVDTVAVCYIQANNLQINRIFGLDDGSTITLAQGNAGAASYISWVTAPSLFAGAVIFNGYNAYQAPGLLPTINYRGDANAKYIEFEYHTQHSGCMNGKTYRIVVVLTSS